VVTDSMRRAIAETERRRKLQEEFNLRHGITPETVRKAVRDVIEHTHVASDRALELVPKDLSSLTQRDIPAVMERIQSEMEAAARRLEFEYAADLRDVLYELEEMSSGAQPARRGARARTPVPRARPRRTK